MVPGASVSLRIKGRQYLTPHIPNNVVSAARALVERRLEVIEPKFPHALLLPGLVSEDEHDIQGLLLTSSARRRWSALWRGRAD